MKKILALKTGIFRFIWTFTSMYRFDRDEARAIFEKGELWFHAWYEVESLDHLGGKGNAHRLCRVVNGSQKRR